MQLLPQTSPQAAQHGPGPWTWDDFVGLVESDRRELLDGHLFEVEMPTDLHENIVAELACDLTVWARQHGGRVLASGYKVRVTAKRGVMPDVQYYRPGRVLGRQGLTEGAPDLVVEVISPTSRGIDRVTKLGYYQQIGTPEYWLVDPESGTVEVYALDTGRWWLRERAIWPVGEDTSDGVLRPASFAGLEISLERLFSAAGEGV